MFLRRFGRHVRRQDWFAVGVDIVVVVVGLFMAFQLDRWWDERGEQLTERTYVQRLITDLEKDIPLIEHAIQLAENRLAHAELLMAVSVRPDLAQEDPEGFLIAVVQAAWTHTPNLNSYTFEDLRSTGNLALIKNQQVKDSLYEYYGHDQSERQYLSLNFSQEFRHFELSAGVLSYAQAAWVQDTVYADHPDAVNPAQDPTQDAAAVQAAGERLGANQRAVDWLPVLRGMQLELMDNNRDRLQRAEAARDALQNYLTSLNGAGED